MRQQEIARNIPLYQVRSFHQNICNQKKVSWQLSIIKSQVQVGILELFMIATNNPIDKIRDQFRD